VWNLYGPTETTIWSTIKELKSGEKVTIGKPIANTQVYLLDKNNELCPIGVPGELCIGGAGLARGYLGRKDLTAERFIANPLANQFDRIYKTGDLARWLPNGEIEYLGRLDNQVKVRGYRIELGEIESILSECSGVRQGAVAVKLDRNKNKKLIAYIVPEGAFDRTAIQQYLKSRLPDYMLPSFLIAIEKIPLTPNGKLDRRALPEPQEAMLTFNQSIDPANETEQKLVHIWKRVLDLPKVSVTDHFFELGGHSLLVTRVLSAIRKEFDLALSVKHLFDWPTIRGLGKYLQSLERESTLAKIEVVENKPTDIPLSFSQERLWFIDKFDGSIAYHMPYLIRFDSNLDVELLKDSLKQTIERHQSLRTVFKMKDGTVSQVVISADGWQLEDSTTAYDANEEQLKSIINRMVNEPFNLSEDFMLRAKLIKNHQSGYALILVLHHIASDAWSNAILLNDMVAIYRASQQGQATELQPLTIQYTDYAIWQRNELNNTFLKEQLAWWEQELNGVSPLKLPLDYLRPKTPSIKGARFEFDLDPNLMADLKALALASESTLFMVFLALYQILLQRYSGQNDICVGTPVANRNYKEIESITGFFVNTVAIRNEVPTDQNFSSFLAKVKNKVLTVFDRQAVPFEQVVNRVEQERDLSRSPIFQVMLIMQNTAQIPALDLGTVQLKQTPLYNEKTHFDLTFLIHETPKGGKVKMEYAAELFKRSTIEQIARHFQNLAVAIVENPLQTIGQLAILDTAEKQKLLKDFNPPAVSFSAYHSVVDWFEKQVEKSPGAIAVVFEQESLTYLELE
ncbi:MAG: condensation domain-containing protein, partial [Bacteroidota bacterium]